MSKRNDNRPLFLIAGVAILGSFGLAYWQFNAKGEAEARVARLQQEVPDEQKLNQQREQTALALSEAQAKLEHLEQGVPTLAYVPTLLRELETLGNQNQIKVTGVRPVPQAMSSGNQAETEKQAKKAYTEIEIDITGRGSYGNVMRMVEALQAFPKIVAVRTVSLTPKAEPGANPSAQPAQPSLEATIRIVAFVFSPESTEKTAPARQAQDTARPEGAAS